MVEKRVTRSTTAAKAQPEGAARGVSNKRKAPIFNEAAQPLRKKFKKRKKFKGNRGKLRDIVDMPVDILFEIFSHLYPSDLLNLARTSQNLRNVLMQRSSISVWKGARSNVVPTMPECLDSISEPDYAELAFGESCHYCDRKCSGMISVWFARKIICDKCIPKHCLNMDEWPSENRCPKRSPLPKLFPKFDFRKFIPKIAVTYAETSSCEAHVKDFAFVEYLTMWETGGKKIRTVRERMRWLESICTEMRAADKFGSSLSDWKRKYIQHGLDENARLVESRKAEIAEYVKSCGWAEEVALMQPNEVRFQNLDDIAQLCDKKLTSRILLGLRHEIHRYMGTVAAARLLRERRAILRVRLPILKAVRNDYAKSFPFKKRPSLPTYTELLAEPAIRDIVLDTPKNVIFTKEHLAPAVANIFPGLIEQLNRRMDDELLDLLRKSHGDAHVINRDTVFGLATTVFRCCSPRVFWYDDILAHPCVSACAFPPDQSWINQSPVVDFILSSEKYHWQKRCTTVNKIGFKVATHIVELCGLDPLTTTKKMIDDLDPIFECDYCHDTNQGRPTMRWNTAIRHYNGHPHTSVTSLSGDVEFTLHLLTGKEADLARERINELQMREWHARNRMALCAHCGEYQYHRGILVEHVKLTHGKELVSVDDLIPDPTEDLTPPIFYMWPPRPW